MTPQEWIETKGENLQKVFGDFHHTAMQDYAEYYAREMAIAYNKWYINEIKNKHYRVYKTPDLYTQFLTEQNEATCKNKE